MQKGFLFVFQRPSHASLHAQEMLDLTLTASAFDQHVSILLIDDGVYSLKTAQEPQKLECKDLTRLFESLVWHEIEHIYMESESLEERGLLVEDLCLAVELVSRAEIGTILCRQHLIINA
ncbi:MAG: sulfurtransferase complex subunit TusC [Methylococcales bacterium]